MTRLYGRAFKNERINDYVPDVRFERTSVMGALGTKGMIAPLAYKGTLNGEFFGVYVKEVLAPAMQKGDTLILDNLSPHKVKGVLKPLIDKGVNVIFLPVYSPDFSPIELAWSKIKAFLRKIKARTLKPCFLPLVKLLTQFRTAILRDGSLIAATVYEMLKCYKTRVWDMNVQKLLNSARKIALNMIRTFKENNRSQRTPLSGVMRENLFDLAKLGDFLDYFRTVGKLD
jgi:transposase